MKLHLKDFLLGALLTLSLVLLIAAAPSGSSKGKYQIATSSVYPDWFVLDTQSGQMYRYTIYSKQGDADLVEQFRLESLGTPDNPEHSVIKTIEGMPWKGYDSRPSPFTQR